MRLHVAVLTTLVAALALAAPASSQARTVIVNPDEAARALYQSWVDEALVPTADVEARLYLESCPTESAWCMEYENGPVSIWVGGDSTDFWKRPRYYTDDDRLAHRLSFLHELGHVFDYMTPTHKYRRVFMRIMGYRRYLRFWQGAVTPGWEWVQPSEQFATAYAYCAMFPHARDAEAARSVWSMYGYDPTPEQYERVCRLLRDPSAPWARL